MILSNLPFLVVGDGARANLVLFDCCTGRRRRCFFLDSRCSRLIRSAVYKRVVATPLNHVEQIAYPSQHLLFIPPRRHDECTALLRDTHLVNQTIYNRYSS